ncbi:MAG: MFS transporter [Syntrophomonadaceae bacterium]|nr:MFS transporter [Syntrophomonadaceae bacterium]MDD3023566.1 MFS transporter [Syntrophomonadaceae bacterium]
MVANGMQNIAAGKDLYSNQSLLIWTRNFTLLCLVNFLMFMSTQMLFPNVPLFLIDIGGNAQDVGYVMGAYTISAMLIRPAAGWLVDKYSRNKIMIGGILLMFLTCLLYNLAENVAIMTLIRIVHGMVFGLASTAIATIVVDSLPVTRLNEGMGYFGLTSTLSMAVAPMIGFWLVGHFGYPMLFAAIALLTGLAFLSSWLVRTVAVPVNTSGVASLGFWSNLLEKTALPAAWVMFFLAVVYGALLCYISLYAVERGISNVGLFFTATALTMLLTRPIAGRWADKGGTNQVLLVGLLTIAAGMLTTGFSHTIIGFILAGLLNGVGFGACMPVLQARAVMKTPVHRRGAATGTFFALFDLGIGLGTIMWGYVAAASSYQTMYYFTLIPVALAGIVYYRYNIARS